MFLFLKKKDFQDEKSHFILLALALLSYTIIGQAVKQMKYSSDLCVYLLIYRLLALFLLLDCQELRQRPNCHSLKTKDREWQVDKLWKKIIYITYYSLKIRNKKEVTKYPGLLQYHLVTRRCQQWVLNLNMRAPSLIQNVYSNLSM